MPNGGENARLAFKESGSGVPVLLLHGLTFDRTTWQPIIDRLGADVRAIAVDLPGHGQTGGSARPLAEVAAAVHDLTRELEIDRPIVVGHSMSGSIGAIYAASYPTLGVLTVDQPLDVRPFGQLLHQIWPALSGSSFRSVFQRFQRSMGLEKVPPPLRTGILDSQTIQRELVIGYWDEVRRADPEQLQRRFETHLRQMSCPFLGVFGRPLASAERTYMAELVSGLQLEEWPDGGHFVHLVDPHRFTQRLSSFIEFCAHARTTSAASASP